MFVRLLIAAFNYYSRPVLHSDPKKDTDLISILIPARNEAHNLPKLLNSILKQAELNYEVIVLDDHSADDTFEIACRFAATNPSISVIKGDPLATGWTGKNFACWQLGRAARGHYMLFLDADVELEPFAISSALGHLKRNRLSLLSLFSEQEMIRISEKGTVPLMYYLLLTLLPLKLISRHPFPVFSAACGQFMLFPADQYRQYQWHHRLKKIIAEDLAIMKAVKQEGLKGAGLMSGGLVRCRMYHTLSDAIYGFSKNFLAPFNDNLALFIPFISVLILGPLWIIASQNMVMIFAMLVSISATRVYCSRLAAEKWWVNMLLHPLQMINLMVISVLAIWQYLLKSAVWKGRRLVIDVKSGNV